MKNRYIFFLLISLFSLTISCKKDKLPAPPGDFTIIGKWILMDSKKDFYNPDNQVVDVKITNGLQVVFEFDKATCKVNGIVTPYSIETPFGRTFVKFPENVNIEGIGNRMEIITVASPRNMLWENERNDLPYPNGNGVEDVAPKTIVSSVFYKP